MPKAIYTNLQSAVAEYTVRLTDPAEFDRQFAEVLSWKLSALISSSLTSGDPYKLAINAAKKYNELLSRASAKAQNEIEEYPTQDSEFISVRL